MSWFWTILLLTFAFSCNSSSEAYKKSSSAVVVGTVYCDTCFQQDNIPKSTHFVIPGATVAVECKDNSKPSFRQQVQTDTHGEFRVRLPFPVSKHLRKIEGCSVKLISSNKPHCSIAAAADSSNLNLKSQGQGTHVFSAGFFAFKPADCDSKISISQLPPIPGLPVPLPLPTPGLPVPLPLPLPTPGLPVPLPLPLPTPGLPVPLPTPGLPVPPIPGLPVPPISGLPVPPIPGLPVPPISGLPVPQIPGPPSKTSSP